MVTRRKWASARMKVALTMCTECLIGVAFDMVHRINRALNVLPCKDIQEGFDRAAGTY